MKTNSIKSYLAVALFTVIGLGSCQKEKAVTPPVVTEHKPVNSNISLSAGTYKEIHDVLTMIMAGSYKQASAAESMASCAAITNDVSVNPHVATIDYGSGCIDNDGIMRSGRIVIQYDSADQTFPGNDIVATFEGFHWDTLEVIGTVSVHVNGLNGNGNTSVTLSSPMQIVNTVTNDTANMNGNLDYEWLAGSETRLRDDDMMDIAGSITGTDFGGNPCSEVIISPLRKNWDVRCRYIIQGVEEIKISGSPDKTIDYGNGSCSGLMTVTRDTTVTVEHQ